MTANETVLTGRCLCGELQFELRGKPRSVGNCHCRMCQRASGAPYVAWATVSREQITFSGRERSLYRSSAKAHRGFCGKCGATVSWESIEKVGDFDICVALLDNPEALKPTYSIWNSARISWVKKDPDLKHFDEKGPG